MSSRWNIYSLHRRPRQEFGAICVTQLSQNTETMGADTLTAQGGGGGREGGRMSNTLTKRERRGGNYGASIITFAQMFWLDRLSLLCHHLSPDVKSPSSSRRRRREPESPAAAEAALNAAFSNINKKGWIEFCLLAAHHRYRPLLWVPLNFGEG